MAGTENVPASFVTASNDSPVALWRTATDAPGITPPAPSITTPESDWPPWAKAMDADTPANAAATNSRRTAPNMSPPRDQHGLPRDQPANGRDCNGWRTASCLECDRYSDEWCAEWWDGESS